MLLIRELHSSDSDKQPPHYLEPFICLILSNLSQQLPACLSDASSCSQNCLARLGTGNSETHSFKENELYLHLRFPQGTSALVCKQYGQKEREPEKFFCTHLSWSRLHSLQQVWDSTGQGSSSFQEVFSTPNFIIHESSKQFHTFGHLSEVGGDGCNCTSHSSVISVNWVPCRANVFQRSEWN